jgi:hypothetical protein
VEPEVPPEVSAAAEALLGIPSRPLGSRTEVFDEVHRLLQDALAEVEGQ